MSPELLALAALGEHPFSAEDEQHLRACAACQAELHSLEAVADVARHSEHDQLLAPPSQVWQRIAAELQLGSPTAAAAAPPPLPVAGVKPAAHYPPAADQAMVVPTAPASAHGVRAASLVLAAVLALVVGIGLGANLDRLVPNQPAASVELNSVPPWTGSSGRATVEEDKDGNRFLVVEMSTPTPPTGVREVWLTNSQADPMMDMGTLQNGSGRFPIGPNVDLEQFRLVDVSQEPVNDPDPHHSGDSIVRGKLPI